jgi:phosphoenolpyruvate synthase/pyruvate phosphate dikinase
MTMVKMAIATVKANGRKIGICGQAASDYPPIRPVSNGARYRFD